MSTQSGLRRIYEDRLQCYIHSILLHCRMSIVGGRGVGKTDAALSLAVGAIKRNRSVLYIAFNHNHAQQIMRDNPTLRGHVISSFNYSLQGRHYDYIIYDRPGNSEELAMVAARCQSLIVVEN